MARGLVVALVLLSERLGLVTDEERRLEVAAATVREAPLWTLDEIRANAADADFIILGAVEPFDAEALSALPRLCAVVRRGVGHDNVDVEAATRLGIIVANVPDASVEEVSDHALSVLLTLERRIVQLDRAVRAGMWQRDPTAIQRVRAPIRRLGELTLGIIGFGRIGQALARKAGSIYAELIAADPFPDPDAARRLGVRLVELGDLFSMADHVSLHAPLSGETRHLIDAAALARMRPGAVIVNTARGGLVDEVALVGAIAEGHIAAAGLDVTEREPLFPDDALLRAENLILTAHSAVMSTRSQAELQSRSVDAALALVRGELPASVVNSDVLASPRLRFAKANPPPER